MKIRIIIFFIWIILINNRNGYSQPLKDSFELNKFNEIGNQPINDIFYSADNSILLATDSGLLIYHSKVKTEFYNASRLKISSSIITNVVKQGDEIWLGTLSGLVHIKNKVPHKIPFQINDIRMNGNKKPFIYDIAIYQNMPIVATSTGLFTLSSTGIDSLTRYTTTPAFNSTINSLVVFDRAIYFTSTNGIYKIFEAKCSCIRSSASQFRAISICDNQICSGELTKVSSNLIFYNNGEWKNTPTELDERYDKAVQYNQIIDDPQNKCIWIASNGLIQYVKSAEFYYYDYQDDKINFNVSEKINCLCTDKEGITWIGTDKGLFYLRLFKVNQTNSIMPRNLTKSVQE